MTSTLKVDQIQNSSGTSGLSIDSNGVVTKSVIPAWRVSRSATQSGLSNQTTVAQFDTTNGRNCFIQGGCTLSSGVITVPVTGIYQINFNLRFDGVGSGYLVGRISINDETSSNLQTYAIAGSPSSSYENATGSDVYSLNANDTVRIYHTVSSDTSWSFHQFSTFSGHLIG